MSDLAGLDQRERLEQLVHRAEAAREDDERLRVLHEHRLAHEEVAEVDGRGDVVVHPLLERQLDVAADRLAAGLRRALVRGLHDARPAAGDHGEAALGQAPRGLLRRSVHRLVRQDARAAEDADRRAEVRQGVEPLDELAHDAEDPPRVRVREFRLSQAFRLPRE